MWQQISVWIRAILQVIDIKVVTNIKTFSASWDTVEISGWIDWQCRFEVGQRWPRIVPRPECRPLGCRRRCEPNSNTSPWRSLRPLRNRRPGRCSISGTARSSFRPNSALPSRVEGEIRLTFHGIAYPPLDHTSALPVPHTSKYLVDVRGGEATTKIHIFHGPSVIQFFQRTSWPIDLYPKVFFFEGPTHLLPSSRPPSCFLSATLSCQFSAATAPNDEYIDQWHHRPVARVPRINQKVDLSRPNKRTFGSKTNETLPLSGPVSSLIFKTVHQKLLKTKGAEKVSGYLRFNRESKWLLKI